jgi:hypothetical protein
MAAAIAVHNILQRMSLNSAAATEVTNVDGQNLSDADNLLQLEDKDIKTLCHVIRWPGENNATVNANSGSAFLAIAKANLKHMI